MKIHKHILLAIVAVMFLSGCGRQVGWLLKPVPLDETLKETVVAKDEGWFIYNKIVIVDVDGLLVNERRSGLFGTEENPVSLFIEKLNKAANDSWVKGIVLRINSPGGGVTASDIMLHQLQVFRLRRNIPVVAIIEDVGASGAYYIACGAERILAHPTSITGSIGVMMQTLSVAGTLRMLGMEAKAITSGPYKDIANPLKPLDNKDLALLQKIINVYYQRFLNVVATGRRNLSKEQIKNLADGRIFTGEQAKANGLVDDLGYLDKAIALTKELAGIRKTKVVIYHRPLGYRANVYSQAPLVTQINLLNISLPGLLETAHPRFLYLWTGKSF